MDILLLIGRILFSAIFINSGIHHLRDSKGVGQYAESGGVPSGQAAAIITGLMILIGGLMILLGIKPAIGALLLVIFLIPTAFVMHKFWGLSDPMMAAMQQAHFMKNLALAGAALILIACGTGTLSLAP